MAKEVTEKPDLELAKIPDADAVRILRDVRGVDEVTARFILAQEKGEIEGDTGDIDDPAA